MTAPVRAARGRLGGVYYGWWLVGLGLLINAAATAPIWGGVGIWVKALELHFGWSRTQLAGAFSFAQLEGSVIGPIAGLLIDRLGTRYMVFVGLMTVGVGFIILSLTTNIYIFYLSYAVIMLGGAVGTFLPLMTAINNWFVRKRSTAMAIAGEGFFLGAIAFGPVLAWAVTPENIGWQTTALWIGVVFLLVAWPVTRLIRDRPSDYGQLPDGDPAPEAATAAQASPAQTGGFGYTAREAMRTRAFWLISFGHALSSMLIATLNVHMIPLLTDQGMSLQTAAYVWAVVMAVGGVFQLIGGYLGDRFPKNVAIFVFATIQAGGFAMAAFIESLPTALLFAVLYGIGFGGRVPLTISIRGDYFGQRAFATITGISMAPLYAFMLVAPLFAGIMFDLRGSYFIPFTVLGALGGLSGVLFLLAKKPPPIDESRRPAVTPASATGR